VFRPGGRRPGGEAPCQDHHQHQPHTVHVRHHAADERRRGESEDVYRRHEGDRAGHGRLRRVRHAGALRDTRTGKGYRRAPGTGHVQGIRAPGRAARRGHVRAAEAGGRPSDVER